MLYDGSRGHKRCNTMLRKIFGNGTVQISKSSLVHHEGALNRN